MEDLLRKRPFGQISCPFSLNRQAIRLKCAKNLTQNGIPSLRPPFSDRLLVPENLFKIEDRIVRHTVGQVADRYGIIPRAMSHQSVCRKTSDPSVYEAILCSFHYEVTLTLEVFRESRLELEHASEVEPNCAMVWAMLSRCPKITSRFCLPCCLSSAWPTSYINVSVSPEAGCRKRP